MKLLLENKALSNLKLPHWGSPKTNVVVFCSLLWVFLLAFIAIYILTHLGQRTVTPNYIDAARHWLQHTDLYNNTGRGFIYLPTSAVFYIPFAIIPFGISELLWRILSLTFFLGSFYWFFRKNEHKDSLFMWLTIIGLPLVFDSLRNGQFHLVMSGLGWVSCILILEQSWFMAAVILAIGFALKPTFIVWVLLSWALYPQLWLRLPLVLLLVFIFPFLTAPYDYVWQQYISAIHMLNQASNLGNNPFEWAQLFGFLAQTGLAIVTPLHQSGIRIFMAIVTLGFAYWVKQKYHKQDALIIVYSLACIYLMLFNPRTENNDYIILAPIIVYWCHQAWINKKYYLTSLYCFLTLLISQSYTLTHLFFPPYKSAIAPAATLIFAVVLVVNCMRGAVSKPLLG